MTTRHSVHVREQPRRTEGTEPHWPEVAFWVALLGGATVALALAVPTDLPGRIFLVASTTTIGWAWVLTSPVRRRRRRSLRTRGDQPRWAAPPQERDQRT